MTRRRSPPGEARRRRPAKPGAPARVPNAPVTGAQYRVTRAGFPGSPAISFGATIVVSDDGQDYEASLVLAAREHDPVGEFGTGSGHRRIDSAHGGTS